MRLDKNKVNLLKGISLMLICAISLCTGQFIWKKYDGFLSILAGFAILALGNIAMLCAYRYGKLSILQPINSINFVIAVIVGAIAFQEPLTFNKICGVVLIMLGIITLSIGGYKNDI